MEPVSCLHFQSYSLKLLGHLSKFLGILHRSGAKGVNMTIYDIDVQKSSSSKVVGK